MTLTPSFVYHAVVEKVIDGDTIDVDLDLGMRIHFKTRLRLEHVDAPEVSTVEGKNAKVAVTALVPVGTAVTVATTKPDKYGRALATVVLPDGTDLSSWVLANVPGAKPYEGGTR